MIVSSDFGASKIKIPFVRQQNFDDVHGRLQIVSPGFVLRLNVFYGEWKAKKLDPIGNTFSLTFTDAYKL